MRSDRAWAAWGMALGLLTIIGCGGSGLQLASVNGVVLLDGRPLEQAHVVFQPIKKGASPSYGDTTADGKFSLSFKRNRKGAVLGTHQVIITTEKLITDPSGKETTKLETLSARYNVNSILKYDVESGTNQFQINLESQGGPPPPTPVTRVRLSC